MFTLSNPSAITFPRFNADNTVSALTATNFRSAIGAGTVTTVNASSTSGNPISIDNNTTTPTIELLSATSARNGYLTSTDWTTFNNKQAALGFTPANSTITIATTAPLQGGGDLTANRTLSITQATTSANGFLTSTDWNTFNNKVNISDTSTMLSPYFQDADTSLLNLTSRFAAKQNNITLTTTGTSGAATLIGSTLNIPQYSGGGGGTGTVTSVGLTAPSIFNVGGSPVTTSGTLALTYSGTALPLLNGGTGATTADGALTNLGATAQGKLLFGLTNTVSDKFIKVNTNNTITLLNAADTRTAIGAGTGSGTVTGVYAAAPIYVSDNTVSPYITIVDASQFVKGVVNETTQTFGGVKTFANTIKLSSTTGTSTSILGKTSDNSVSTVSVGTGLSLTSGTLSSTITVHTERYVWDLGIFAGAADNSAATWDPQYGINMLVVPTTLNGYCIDSIYARALTCSTCPPAAGDKDYYIGVYKAGNSTRIQTTGMSLQGSQIAMNEYDLKEVNVNYTLTTGDVWWLYLNGTYTSDMLYITGGFVIKKTCN
jgi:hypothetical protein